MSNTKTLNLSVNHGLRPFTNITFHLLYYDKAVRKFQLNQNCKPINTIKTKPRFQDELNIEGKSRQSHSSNKFSYFFILHLQIRKTEDTAQSE